MQDPRYVKLSNPTGWFAVAFSDEVAAGELLNTRLCGEELVVFRTEAGHAAVVDAYCPHMGAHFGHGGSVEGESLRCPFHGFCFDTSGKCVKTPYQRKVPRVSAGVRPVREQDGVILTWFDAAGREPDWEVPRLPEDSEYGKLRTHVWRSLRSHPQETTENSVDLGHLSVVHGYQRVRALSPLRTDGPYLNARYAMDRKNPFFPGMPAVGAEFEVHVHGLGYSFIDVDVPSMGIKGRHFVFSTPVEEGRVDLRAALRLKLRKVADVALPLAVLPKRWVQALVEELVLRAYVHDIAQDFDIWQNKRYTERPVLADGDGPVGPYRKWCRQFYPALPVLRDPPAASAPSQAAR